MINLPIGTSDFRQIRQEERLYIDKTLLLKEIMDGGKVILATRPRRFGKTLNLSTLRYFYGCDGDNAALFHGLAIERAGEWYMSKCGRHPVLFATFKDIKDDKWKDAEEGIWSKLFRASAFFEKIYPEIRDQLPGDGREVLDRFFARQPLRRDAESILKHLCEAFYMHYGADAVLLIDEYDTPVITAYSSGYYDECIAFLRDLFSGGLKDNEHLEKAVLTGIIRVAKESMFSGLNNFTAWSVMASAAADKFGFTESEVRQVLAARELNGSELDDLRRWYNGYLLGGLEIYNPWSVLQFAENVRDGFRPYWVNTSDNRLLKTLFFEGASAIRDDIDQLLAGEWLTKKVAEHLVFPELKTNKDAVWNLLLAAGYLKCSEVRFDHLQQCYVADLRIPNMEVQYVYAESIRTWLAGQTNPEQFDEMLNYLAAGNLVAFEELLARFMEQVASYHDVSAPAAENFYHALFLGMLARLGHRYSVRSNRESGLGRYDIAMFPRNPQDRGIIIEIKTPSIRRNESLEDALAAAVKQLEEQRYAADMTAHGVAKVLHVALAVQGKEFLVKEAKV